jgi:hypothetical protein
MNTKLTWREHIVKKRKQIDLMFKQIYWFLGRKLPLSLENKVLVYKFAIKPIWTYGIELWVCASNSSIAILQRCQSKYSDRWRMRYGTYQIPPFTTISAFYSSKMLHKKEAPNIMTD